MIDLQVSNICHMMNLFQFIKFLQKETSKDHPGVMSDWENGHITPSEKGPPTLYSVLEQR